MLREAVLAFEKIIKRQVEQTGSEDGISESDKKHLHQIILVLARNFGTDNTEWFCAAETTLNTLFNMRQRFSHEQAKMFIDLIQRKCFVQKAREEAEQRDSLFVDKSNADFEPVPLRIDLTEHHYS